MTASKPQIPGINWFSLAVIRILALAAAAVAAYLTWVTLAHGTVAGCGDQAANLACDDVLRSVWSRVVGVPVSLLGGLVYVSILLCSTALASAPRRPPEWRRRCCLILIATAFASAVWFLFLQLVVIGHICPFCLMIHICGIMIALILWTTIVLNAARDRRPSYMEFIQRLTGSVPKSPATRAPSSKWTTRALWPTIVSVVAVTSMISLQLLFPSKTHEVFEADTIITSPVVISGRPPTDLATQPDTMHSLTPDVPSTEGEATITAASALATEQKPVLQPTDAQKRSFLKGRLVIDINDHGLLGSPEADFVVIELVDYKCPDCRQLHQYLKEVREKLGSRFAVVVFPVPLETDCNPYIRSTHSKHVGACKYAKLALAVFNVVPHKFEQFHDWMMDTNEPPAFDQATRYAKELVGPEHDLSQAESTRLKDYMRLFNVAKIQRLPAMIVRDKVMIGMPNSADAILQMIETPTPSE